VALGVSSTRRQFPLTEQAPEAALARNSREVTPSA
jgi:hypothetical protein